jgi:NitT/TauT family transport system substrate-binding protein
MPLGNLRRASRLAAFALAALALCALPFTARAQSKLIPITYLYVPVNDYAPLFVAKEKGYFEQLGLDVDLEPKQAQAESIQLIAGGKVQASSINWGSSTFNALSGGAPITVVGEGEAMPTSGKMPARFLMSKSAYDASHGNPAMLKGKRVALIGAGGYATYLTSLALQKSGLAVGDVDLTYIPAPNIGLALENGSIDAAQVFEPFATQYEVDGIAKTVAPDAGAGSEVTAIAVNTDFLKQNEDAVVRLVAGYIKATRFLNAGGWKDPVARDEILKYTKTDPKIFAQIGYPRYAADGAVNMPSVRAQEAFFKSIAMVKYSGELDLKPYYRRDIAQKALKLLASLPAKY